MEDQTLRLRLLRDRAERINASLLEDLRPFLGATNNLLFRRLPDSNEQGNVTTTCSCLMAMTEPGSLVDFFTERLPDNVDVRKHIQAIFNYIIEAPWTSSGLPDGNAFSSLLTLRTAGLLFSGPERLLDASALKAKHTFPVIKTDKIEDKLFRKGQVADIAEILGIFGTKAPEGFEVEDYPSKSAMAYWFIDALEGLRLLAGCDPNVLEKISRWCAENFARQVSLASSHHDALKDPIEMAMAACLSQRFHRILADYNPSSRDQILGPLPTAIEIQDAVVKFFSYQLDSGIWPKYFPLFNYLEGGAGSNYLFSFEVLEAVTDEFGRSSLFENDHVLSGIERALSWCDSNRLEYEHQGKRYSGWNSGGQLTSLRLGKPESWATAMVHMFLWKLRSALSHLIENHVLARYASTRPAKPADKPCSAWDKILDSPLEILGTQTTAKKVLKEQILDPILAQGAFRDGRIQQRRRSALLFGPPGTAKTSIVRAMARVIGWPLVELDPSHFLRNGLENIYSRADEIFKDLLDLTKAVVFFDEMDALTQSREGQIDVTRQFLTTSMLPKLSRLHGESRVLFFMATNHLRNFDDAIKRPGRFDLLIHVRPPSWSAKLEHLEWFWPGWKSNYAESTWSTKQRKADRKFVKTKLTSWTVSPEIVKAFNRFTPGELESFLETFGEGPGLRPAIEAAGRTSFLERADFWGKQYIALHSEKTEKPSSDLSLYDEYEVDLTASRM